MAYFLICIFSVLGTAASESVQGTSTVELKITNIKSSSGKIHVAFYDQEESFKKSKNPYLLKKFDSTEEAELQVQIEGVPPGKYAIAIYHDVNANEDLDKNFFGIPKEPYGFSNNPKAKWSAPRFNEIAFDVKESSTAVSIILKKWKHR